MGKRNKELLPESAKLYSGAVGKAQRMSTYEMLNWIDAVGTEMAQAVNDYRRTGELVSALELRRAAAQILGLTEELVVRTENES